MNPVATALLLLGYGLALPIGTRMPAIVRRQHRVALFGHQVGVIAALLGWLARGSITIAVIHVVWLIGVRLWFQMAAPNRSASPSSG